MEHFYQLVNKTIEVNRITVLQSFDILFQNNIDSLNPFYGIKQNIHFSPLHVNKDINFD